MKRDITIGILIILVSIVLIVSFLFFTEKKDPGDVSGYIVWTGTTKITNVSWSAF